MDGHLGCIYILAIINNAAMDTGVHISFQIIVFIFFKDKYPGVKLLGHMIVLFLVFFLFFFLRNLHTLFHSGHANLNSHKQYMSKYLHDTVYIYYLWPFFMIAIRFF